MKLQIDTQARTITLNSPVNLGELVVMLDNMFPQESWKQYELIMEKVIEWNPLTPIIPYQPTNPVYPWWGPTYVEPSIPWSPSVTTCSSTGLGTTVTTAKKEPFTYTVTF